jgi:hypothetical protein
MFSGYIPFLRHWKRIKPKIQCSPNQDFANGSDLQTCLCYRLPDLTLTSFGPHASGQIPPSLSLSLSLSLSVMWSPTISTASPLPIASPAPAGRANLAGVALCQPNPDASHCTPHMCRPSACLFTWAPSLSRRPTAYAAALPPAHAPLVAVSGTPPLPLRQ